MFNVDENIDSLVTILPIFNVAPVTINGENEYFTETIKSIFCEVI